MANTELDRLFDELTRSFIGFDRWYPAFTTRPAIPSFPPYDVVKGDNNHYAINIALAGYNPDDINIEEKDGMLVVEGAAKPISEDDTKRYVHRGIAKRSFRLAWTLDDHMEVIGAKMDNGMLSIGVVRNVPESAQPKRIPIQVAGALEYKPEETIKERVVEPGKAKSRLW
jgi:molecular chaperone IbpA